MDSTMETEARDDLRNADAQVITVWSDIGCPWATLAVHTLHETAAGLGKELVLDHRAFPLEMYNRRATPKLVIDAEVVAIAGLVADVGMLQWSRDPFAYPVSTLPALEAVQIAKELAGLRASTELDLALRRAMYTEQRCISILSEVEDVASHVAVLDIDAFAESLRRGDGRTAVMDQWQVSRSDAVQGSPQILTAAGTSVHNPGVDYTWTRPPQDGGVPRLHSYNSAWAHELLVSPPSN